MSNYNKCIFIGNITRDPQLKTLPSGSQVAETGIAVNNKYTTKTGESKEEVMFLDVAIFGKGADTFGKWVKKGKPMLLDGRLKVDQWEKDGQKRSKHSLVVDNFQFLGDGGSKKEGNSPSDKPQPPQSSGFGDGPPLSDDDVPF